MVGNLLGIHCQRLSISSIYIYICDSQRLAFESRETILTQLLVTPLLVTFHSGLFLLVAFCKTLNIAGGTALPEQIMLCECADRVVSQFYCRA